MLLIVLTYFSESFGFDLKCEPVLLNDDLSYQFKKCNAYDLVITSPEQTITSVNQNTEPSNYIGLIIQNQKVNFVPKNIAEFFPLLEELEISNSSLEWIEQENIKELTDLTTLNLEKNELEILDEGLFKFNEKLETVKIRDNLLKFIHKDIFVYRTNLREIDIEQNICGHNFHYYDNYEQYFRDAYNYRNYVQKSLQNYCQNWEHAITAYKKYFNKRINTLNSEKEIATRQLTHQLKTCDRNFDAALENLRLQKLITSNMESIDKPMDGSVNVLLYCKESFCVAVNFEVSFANLSLSVDEYYKDLNITSLRIHQQPTLFLPQNLAERFPYLSEMSVIESGLYEIDFSVFEGLDLLNLNLTKNKIREVPVDTFVDLENLQELDLSFNKIHTLNDDVFAGLKNLQKLYLNNNFLLTIKVELVKSLKNLSGLFLHGNQLKFIGATLLTPLTSLESVDLSGNVCIDMTHPASSLLDIESTIIDNCIAPVELNCKMNRNATSENGEIENSFCNVDGLFIEYPKTKILKLNGEGGGGSNNSVKVFFADNQSMKFFPYQLSHQLPNLERIEIQQSKLKALHRMDFNGFSKLTEIVMNRNNLSSISQGSFDTVLQLELLDLSSNHIVALPSKIFAKLSTLHTLLLSDNQIVRFTADLLPRKNSINVFCVDHNQLEFIETKTIRFLRKAKLIDLTENACIDMKFAKTENATRALVELSGEIDLNCSVDDYD